jgi:hypothetical protein
VCVVVIGNKLLQVSLTPVMKPGTAGFYRFLDPGDKFFAGNNGAGDEKSPVTTTQEKTNRR